MILLFCLLLVSHAVCDYPLQGEFLSKFKNPAAGPFMGEAIWPWILGSHAAIHAGGVFIVTQSSAAMAFEFVAHCVIDIGKYRGWFGFHVDQTLHVLCKVIIVTALMFA